MGVWQFQSVLNRGEIDPLAVGRIDLQQYYNGVETAKNVLAIPQGGLKKRPGMRTLSIFTNYDCRLERFSFNTEINYLFSFISNILRVYKDGVLQATVGVPIAGSQLQDMDYIQSADTAIITHPEVAPFSITRQSDTVWTVAVLTLQNVPVFDFNDALSPTPTDSIQTMTFTNFFEGDRFKLSLEGILTEEIVLSITATGQTATALAIEEELKVLPNVNSQDVSVVGTGPGTFTVTFTGGATKAWDSISGTGVYTQSVSFTITSVVTQVGVPRTEDVWSPTRGYPITCTFHEGRLWFGGAKSLPSTVWGSVVNDFFNFKTRKGLDDESVSATLDTDQLNQIQAIFSNRSLQVFTGGGEFYVPSSPITPANIAVQPQSNLGSKRIRPVTVEGVTLFLQKTGKALLQFVFLDEFQANQTTSVSVLAPHLIKTPIKMSVSRGTEDSDANYVYILNSDGTITVFNTLTDQQVAGFTRGETDGNIKSIAVVDGSLYFLVERTTDSGTELYLEIEDDRLNTDAAAYAGSGIAAIGVGLIGKTVKIKVDGSVREDVVSTGTVTIDPASTTSVEVGLEYDAEITTLPLNLNLQNGPNASQKKKILRTSLQLYESIGVLINGQRLADKTIGVDQFDAPTPFTGLKRIFIPGWSLEAQVTISQTTPMPMTILNIGMEVKT